MKNYKLKQFFENLLLISIVLIVVYFIISFIISIFSIKKFALPSFSMPKFDYNISIPKINTDFLLDKFKENNITIKENNISNDNNITKTIINENDTNINVKTFEITTPTKSTDKNTTIKPDLNTSNIKDANKSIDSNLTITEQNTTVVNIPKEVKPVKKDKLEEYIDLSLLNINKHKNKVSFSPEEEKYIKIKFKVLKTGKFKRLIYLSGNKDLIGEARIAIKRSFPHKPNKSIQSQFPRYITTTLQYD